MSSKMYDEVAHLVFVYVVLSSVIGIVLGAYGEISGVFILMINVVICLLMSIWAQRISK